MQELQVNKNLLHLLTTHQKIVLIPTLEVIQPREHIQIQEEVLILIRLQLTYIKQINMDFKKKLEK
ncbi:MAG: hypothetical protein CL827_05360 [Crocinitomicaceae bacterium]|nr:hypothetical protein [Crocinitomicaceae bacterium]